MYMYIQWTFIYLSPKFSIRRLTPPPSPLHPWSRKIYKIIKPKIFVLTWKPSENKPIFCSLVRLLFCFISLYLCGFFSLFFFFFRLSFLFLLFSLLVFCCREYLYTGCFYQCRWLSPHSYIRNVVTKVTTF